MCYINVQFGPINMPLCARTGASTGPMLSASDQYRPCTDNKWHVYQINQINGLILNSGADSDISDSGVGGGSLICISWLGAENHTSLKPQTGSILGDNGHIDIKKMY